MYHRFLLKMYYLKIKVLIKMEFRIFEDVSEKSGAGANNNGTFSTWFWDYDNDGWLRYSCLWI